MTSTKSVTQINREHMNNVKCLYHNCVEPRSILSEKGVFCIKHKGANPDKPYSAYKIDVPYCENIDGRLGFMCETRILDECMLTVDHIDGIHQNNERINLQSLCACCQNYKTKICDDWQRNHVKEAREPLYANYQYPWIDTKHPCPF